MDEWDSYDVTVRCAEPGLFASLWNPFYDMEKLKYDEELAEDSVEHLIEDYNYVTKRNYMISDAFYC